MVEASSGYISRVPLHGVLDHSLPAVLKQCIPINLLNDNIRLIK